MRATPTGWTMKSSPLRRWCPRAYAGVRERALQQVSVDIGIVLAEVAASSSVGSRSAGR